MIPYNFYISELLLLLLHPDYSLFILILTYQTVYCNTSVISDDTVY